LIRVSDAWKEAEVIPRSLPLVSMFLCLAEASTPGDRVWPRYPRASTNLADHCSALELVGAGLLNPENLWQ